MFDLLDDCFDQPHHCFDGGLQRSTNCKMIMAK